MKTRTIGTRSRAAPATTSAAARQPACATTAARSGRKSSWPVAVLAVRMPMTSPRRATNQRLAMVAASTSARAPVPIPTTTPQSRTSCQGARITVVSATPTVTAESDRSVTRRTPTRSISAAANGPAEAVEQEVHRHRERDGGPAPPEGLLQRNDEHAGGGPDGRRGEEREEGDARR